MTAEQVPFDVKAEAAKLVARSRAAQGLPPRVGREASDRFWTILMHAQVGSPASTRREAVAS